MSAYADYINVFVQGQGNIQELHDSLTFYEKASSAKLNWGKSKACLIRSWTVENTTDLPGSLM